MKLEKIFETDEFIIWKDNKGFDFAYDIENKTDEEITIKYGFWEEEITIKGSLESTSDIDDLDLEFRIWMEYVDDSGDKHTVFYKTTI